jgi:hypothetical protein
VLCALTLVGVVALSARAAADPDDGLVGHWTFDDPPGSTTAASALPEGPPGILEAGAFLDGSRLHLDGSPAGKVVFPAEVGQLGDSDFTIAFYFGGHCMYRLCDVAGNRAAQGHANFLQFRLAGALHEFIHAGTLSFALDQGPPIVEYASTEFVIQDDAVVHVAATRRDLDVSLWINGVRVSTDSTDERVVVRNAREFRLGRSLDSTSFTPEDFNVNGVYDDLRIYSRALAPCDIAAIAGVDCPRQCHSVRDCAAPLACSPEGRCIERPPAEAAGCNMGTTSGSWWLVLLALWRPPAATEPSRRRRLRRGA